MKIIILTTSVYGTTGHHLQQLIDCKDVEIAMVVVSRGAPPNTQKKRMSRLKKIMKIGVFGALNGIRMRKWYNEDIRRHTTIGNAEEICAANNIPFCYVPYTNSNETKTVFEQTGAEVGLSLGNGYISKKIFSILRYGMINIHHEILPAYQNAQSIIWQLHNGSAETGYTIHKISSKIDGGDILLQEAIPIEFRDTLADTVAYNYARLFDASAKGLIKVLTNFKTYFDNAKPQGSGNHYTTPSLRQFIKISWQFAALKKRARK